MPALLRAALAGLATGARSSTAIAAYARTPAGPGRVDRLLQRKFVRKSVRRSALLELIGDKLPQTPPRTAPPSLAARSVLGALSGGLVARRGGGSALAGAVVGAGASTAWTFAGPRYRALAAGRAGNDLPGALVEDGAALALARIAARRGRASR